MDDQKYPRCTNTLRAAGEYYPRSCEECGLGPCKSSLAQMVKLDQVITQRDMIRHVFLANGFTIKPGQPRGCDEACRQVCTEGGTLPAVCTTASADGLPPLPPRSDYRFGKTQEFTADQMQAYARQVAEIYFQQGIAHGIESGSAKARADALEEAARLCALEGYDRAAMVIRALNKKG
jgi:hypothetical protein